MKSLLKTIIHSFGFRVWRIPRAISNGLDYELVPNYIYAPWQGDMEFCKAYKLAEQHTLVDRYRAYELWCLVDQTSHLVGEILEVGTWRGGTGCLMAKRGGKAILADTFRGVVKTSEIDRGYRDGAHADSSKQDVIDLSRSMGTEIEILEGIFPDDTGNFIEDRKFRLCHIDVDIYNSAKDILNWVWPRMIHGGIVVFDDYGFNTTPGITKLVNEYNKNNDLIFVYNLNGHALFIKI